MPKRTFFILLISFLCADFAVAQNKKAVAIPEAPGPWLFGTIGVGQNADKTSKTTALKGLAIKVGANQEAAVCYDLDLCRMAGAWTGGKFTTPMNMMSRGEYPTALGEVAFTSRETAGWLAGATAEPWKDPRREPFGPLPEVRYRGLYTLGSALVLRWEVQGATVLERPEFRERDGWQVFIRHLHLEPTAQPLRLVLCELPADVAGGNFSMTKHTVEERDRGEDYEIIGKTATLPDRQLAVALCHLPGGEVVWGTEGAWVTIPPQASARSCSVAVAVHREEAGFATRRAERLLAGEADHSAEPLYDILAKNRQRDLPALLKSVPAVSPAMVETSGELSTANEDAYVVDTIKLPDPNPWGAPMFLGGLDFFSDGRAAVCTFQGDVFIVSGLDEKLEHVTWRRFATGLYHALGLKIVNDEVYVTGRDGITRLRDLNGDGEADFYEAFNFDVKVTKSFHEFVFDLQTDPAGNFYFAKAGPVKNGGRGFDQICEHHGALFRVSPDGKKFGVVATGFRAPNGIGVGPNGEMTSGDNEGTWTPVCRLNWIKDGGFYGVVPLAHWPDDPPADYDKPLCWLPKRVDNSSGSQVWAGRRWGPWSGELLHLSYGTCTLFGVLKENVHVAGAPECCENVMQGGVVAFPLKFQSGIMRARFHPIDGQLYVAGLRGWQTSGVKNGAFQRVRYTGKPVRMPIGLAARQGGVEVKFTCSLDTQQATDPENWNVEVWNYLWTSAYGSPEVSTLTPVVAPGEVGKEGEGQFSKAQMSKPQHDTLNIKSIAMGTDDRTVFLEIPDLQPVMQMSIKFRLKAADGQELKGEIVNTINALGE